MATNLLKERKKVLTVMNRLNVHVGHDGTVQDVTYG